jgi:hypothetical protein
MLCDRLASLGTVDSPLHLFTECDHPVMMRLRREVEESAARLLMDMADRLEAALVKDGRPFEDRTATATHAAALKAALPAIQWASPDGAALLFRLLAMAPVPPRLCEAALGRRLLGTTAWARLLHSVCVRERWLRPIVNRWMQWAARWIDKAATQRATLLGMEVWRVRPVAKAEQRSRFASIPLQPPAAAGGVARLPAAAGAGGAGAGGAGAGGAGTGGASRADAIDEAGDVSEEDADEDTGSDDDYI